MGKKNTGLLQPLFSNDTWIPFSKSAIHYATLNNNTRTILQLGKRAWYIFDSIWILINCVKILITATFSQMRSCVHPNGSWTAFLAHWEFTLVGQAPAALDPMRAGVRPPLLCVQQSNHLSDRSRVRGDGESNPGWVAVLLRDIPLL